MRREYLYAAGTAGVLLIGAAAIVASLGVGPRGTDGATGDLSPVRIEDVATVPASRCSCGGSCGEAGGLTRAGTSFGNTANTFQGATRHRDEAGGHYRCPMHPQVASRIPGMCPVCRGSLSEVPERTSTGATCHCPNCPSRPRAEGPSSARSTTSR